MLCVCVNVVLHKYVHVTKKENGNMYGFLCAFSLNLTTTEVKYRNFFSCFLCFSPSYKTAPADQQLDTPSSLSHDLLSPGPVSAPSCRGGGHWTAPTKKPTVQGERHSAQLVPFCKSLDNENHALFHLWPSSSWQRASRTEHAQ